MTHNWVWFSLLKCRTFFDHQREDCVINWSWTAVCTIFCLLLEISPVSCRAFRKRSDQIQLLNKKGRFSKENGSIIFLCLSVSAMHIAKSSVKLKVTFFQRSSSHLFVPFGLKFIRKNVDIKLCKDQSSCLNLLLVFAFSVDNLKRKKNY